MKEFDSKSSLSFWDHIDEFRAVVIRITIGLGIIMPIVFLCKDLLFNIILAPSKSDFIIYRFFCRLSQSQIFYQLGDFLSANGLLPDGFSLGEALSLRGLCPSEVSFELINTQLAAQFTTHITLSIYGALIIIFPYIIYQLYGFISPALYEKERKYSIGVISTSFILFMSGVLLNYFLIFPLSFRFLASYQVASEVSNMITLSSYVSTFTMLSFMMGIVFEIPILTWFLSRLGIISYDMMKSYRKHVFVGVLILAAVITPTGDVVTLMLVAAPIYLLHEISLLMIKNR